VNWVLVKKQSERMTAKRQATFLLRARREGETDAQQLAA
jgi:hypothetical protein